MHACRDLGNREVLNIRTAQDSDVEPNGGRIISQFRIMLYQGLINRRGLATHYLPYVLSFISEAGYRMQYSVQSQAFQATRNVYK